jgi:hypothetical protein
VRFPRKQFLTAFDQESELHAKGNDKRKTSCE